MTLQENVIEMTGITKRFGANIALENVSFDLRKGEVHALLGMNGAGKSTIIKILSGLYKLDAGQILFNGRSVTIGSPAAAIQLGIVAVQQHPELVSTLTGYENVYLGREGDAPGLLRLVSARRLADRAADLLRSFPIPIDLSLRVSRMSAVERELVAILQALAYENASVLILDEPTSTLTEQEKDHLFLIMRMLKRKGISIIYITHRLEEVFSVADRLTVFRNGKHILTMETEDAPKESSFLAEKLLGEPLQHLYPGRREIRAERSKAILTAENISGRVVKDVSFDARAGEILGVFGLVGSGIDELSKLLFGAAKVRGGRIAFKGVHTSFKSPADALGIGIFLLPGDRLSEGLTLETNVMFNMTLSNLCRASNRVGLLKSRENQKKGLELARSVGLQPANLSKPAGEFSGGNQQKIVVAKGIYCQSDLYIFVEPTVGVDIGARSRIYALMRELSRTAAVMIMSSDSDEVYGISDKMFALFRGLQVGSASSTISRESLLLAGISGKAA